MNEQADDARLENPFKANCYAGIQTYHLTVEDRLNAVKAFDQAQCEAALRVAGLQKTVERAIQSQLRRLKRA